MRAERDQAAAGELRSQVMDAPGIPKAWPKITTVLDKFEAKALTHDSAARIDHALTHAGLCVEPKLSDLKSRSGTICLSVPEAHPDDLHFSDPIRTIELKKIQDGGSTGELMWIDIDVLAADQSTIEGAVRELCPDATSEIVEDLYLSDAVPKVQVFESGPRGVSVASFEACEPHSLDRERGEVGVLKIGMLEIVAGDGWLITSWHRERILKGVREDVGAGEMPARARLELIKSVKRAWDQLLEEDAARWRTSGDLGLLILEEATREYEQARLTMSAWLDAWELSFYSWASEDDPDPQRLEQKALVNLRALVAEFKRCVTPLDVPRERAKEYWFDRVTSGDRARDLDEYLDSTLKGLDLLGDRIRGAFDLLHLQISQAQDRNTKRLQDLLGKVTALLVVPALVAAFFGANTWLPGGNDVHAHVSFFIMVAAMALGVLGAWFFLQRHDHR